MNENDQPATDGGGLTEEGDGSDDSGNGGQVDDGTGGAQDVASTVPIMSVF